MARARVSSEIEEDEEEANAGCLDEDVADATGTVATRVFLSATSGGSSKNVYSRTKRPVGQFSSTNTSTNGSLIGVSEATRITGFLPARLSSVNVIPRNDVV